MIDHWYDCPHTDIYFSLNTWLQEECYWLVNEELIIDFDFYFSAFYLRVRGDTCSWDSYIIFTMLELRFLVWNSVELLYTKLNANHISEQHELVSSMYAICARVY